MFERYTDGARQAIFWGLHHARDSKGAFIETEHLLLGLLNADHALALHFLKSEEEIAAVRKQLGASETVTEHPGAKDMPLSQESKRVLAYSAEESERHGVQHIGAEHLFLGLLREEKSCAARVLRERGLELTKVREEIHSGNFTASSTTPGPAGTAEQTSTPARDRKAELHRLIDELPENLWDSAAITLRGLLGGGAIVIAGGRAWAADAGRPPSGRSIENYSEKVRRTLFFARYEASQFGSMSIESEHLLLGMVREDRSLALRVLNDYAAIEALRREIEQRRPAGKTVSTSIDLPLSEECKRAMAFAVEEAAHMSQEQVSNQHLLIGLLREEKCFASELLRARGLDVAKAREILSGPQ